MQMRWPCGRCPCPCARPGRPSRSSACTPLEMYPCHPSSASSKVIHAVQQGCPFMLMATSRQSHLHCMHPNSLLPHTPAGTWVQLLAVRLAYTPETHVRSESQARFISMRRSNLCESQVHTWRMFLTVAWHLYVTSLLHVALPAWCVTTL